LPILSLLGALDALAALEKTGIEVFNPAQPALVAELPSAH